MASVKIVLRKEEKKDGTYPLAIRITKDRKSSFIYTEYSVRKDDWNPTERKVKKSHPNSTRLNNLLLKKLSDITDKALDLETKQDHKLQSCKTKSKAIGREYFFRASR